MTHTRIESNEKKDSNYSERRINQVERKKNESNEKNDTNLTNEND